jgi:hypothetical protein
VRYVAFRATRFPAFSWFTVRGRPIGLASEFRLPEILRAMQRYEGRHPGTQSVAVSLRDSTGYAAGNTRAPPDGGSQASRNSQKSISCVAARAVNWHVRLLEHADGMRYGETRRTR